MTRGRNEVIDYTVGIAGEVMTLTVRQATGSGVNFWSYVNMLTPGAQLGMLVSLVVSSVAFWVLKRTNREGDGDVDDNDRLGLIESVGVMLTLIIQRDCLVTRRRTSERLLYFVAGKKGRRFDLKPSSCSYSLRNTLLLPLS